MINCDCEYYHFDLCYRVIGLAVDVCGNGFNFSVPGYINIVIGSFMLGWLGKSKWAGFVATSCCSCFFVHCDQCVVLPCIRD